MVVVMAPPEPSDPKLTERCFVLDGRTPEVLVARAHLAPIHAGRLWAAEGRWAVVDGDRWRCQPGTGGSPGCPMLYVGPGDDRGRWGVVTLSPTERDDAVSFCFAAPEGKPRLVARWDLSP